MTRLAVKTYVQRQMALLDVPVPCQILIQRPKVIEVGEQGVIVVTIPSSKEARFTTSRGAGRKQIVHQARLDVYWLAADGQRGGAAFDDLLEQIDMLFRTTALPIAITDPESGAGSVIVWIGEEIETSVAEPLLDESLQGLVVFAAQKTLVTTEQTVG